MLWVASPENVSATRLFRVKLAVDAEPMADALTV